jgi:hypothetical protein
VLPTTAVFGLGLDHVEPTLPFHVALGLAVLLGFLDLLLFLLDRLIPESPFRLVHLFSP